MTAVLPVLPETDTTIWVRFDGREIGLELAMLTPDRARDLLENYNNNNRKISQPDVLKYARDMRDKLWLFTGEPIIIGEDGNMCDGQHRCQAVVDSEMDAPVLIVYNISREAMCAIDQGKSRTVRDILQTSGSTQDVDMPYDTVMSSTAKLLMEGNRALSKYADNRQRVAKYVQDYFDLLSDYAAWAKSVYNTAPLTEVSRSIGNGVSKAKCVAPAALAALAITMEHRGGEREAIREFFEKVTGKMRADNDAEHQAYSVIRRYLIVTAPLNRTEAKFSGLMALYETLINAFNRVESVSPMRKMMPPREAVRWFDELPRVDRAQ